MKIELDEKTLITLLRAVYLSNWLINSHRLPDEWEVDSNELTNQLYQIGHEAGFTDYFTYVEKLNNYSATIEFEERMWPFIEDNNDSVFWEELSQRLADRDVAEELGEKLKRMSNTEIFTATQEFVAEYDEEFELNGLENLRLLAAAG